jgi:flagellar protein FlaG
VANIVHINGYDVPVPKREVRPVGEKKIALTDVKPPSDKMGAEKPKISKHKVPASPERTKMSYAEISKMLSRVNIYLDQFEIQASYTIDEVTGGIQIEIVNRTTGEVIRKIPPYEAARLFSDIEEAAGLLMDQQA